MDRRQKIGYADLMHISWHGQYTLKFQTGNKTAVIDPYAPSAGLRPFRSQADLVALTWPSHPETSHLAGIQGSPAILAGAGEYSVHGFSLHALPWTDADGRERTIQRWHAEDLYLINLASLNRELQDSELQELEKVDTDVLLLPIGGGQGLSTAQAQKMVTVIEPRLVIPIHFALPGLKEKLTDVKEFASAFGLKASQAEKKIIVKAGKLASDDMQVSLLIP